MIKSRMAPLWYLQWHVVSGIFNNALSLVSTMTSCLWYLPETTRHPRFGHRPSQTTFCRRNTNYHSQTIYLKAFHKRKLFKHWNWISTLVKCSDRFEHFSFMKNLQIVWEPNLHCAIRVTISTPGYVLKIHLN